MTLFDQAYQQMQNNSCKDLRVFNEIAFTAKLIGMSAQGTGPYRQVLTEMMEELHQVTPRSILKQPLFIAAPNSTSTDMKCINRDAIVPNPSCGSMEALNMYSFFGRLIGIAIRNTSQGTMLPLYLTR